MQSLRKLALAALAGSLQCSAQDEFCDKGREHYAIFTPPLKTEAQAIDEQECCEICQEFAGPGVCSKVTVQRWDTGTQQVVTCELFPEDAVEVPYTGRVTVYHVPPKTTRTTTTTSTATTTRRSTTTSTAASMTATTTATKASTPVGPRTSTASTPSSAFRTTATTPASFTSTASASPVSSSSTTTSSANSTSPAPNANEPGHPNVVKNALYALLVLALLLCCCILLLLGRRKRKVAVRDPLLSASRSRSNTAETSLTELVPEEHDIPGHAISFGKELGKGSFGTVSLCKWQGGDVAVKCMAKWGGDEIETEALSKTFLQEFRVSFGLTSPRIVRVYGICTTVPDCLSIVLEYCAGGALRQRLDELGTKPPAIEESITWGLDIALGMEYLHQHNIMHRDLKSANVLLVPPQLPLQPYARAKVADFGLATAKDMAEETVGITKSGGSLSGTGSTMGTVSGSPQWMSPEAINGRRTFSSDVYAYGIVLWEVSTSLKPYAGQGIVTVLYRVSVEKARPSPLPEPIPGSDEDQHPLLELITTCWQHEEEVRPSFVEASKLMREIMEQGDYETASEAQSPRKVGTF